MSKQPFKEFFQFTAPTRVIAGYGLLAEAGFEFAKEGASKCLLITDKTIRETGLVDKVVAGLEDGEVTVAAIFDAVPQDSNSETVAAAAELAKAEAVDSLVAVGGGSVLDTAKLANVLLTHGGSPRDWEGYFTLPRAEDGSAIPLGPLACIPTTAGTGSEVSFVTMCKDPVKHVKYLTGDFMIFPDLAILDPESTRTLPPQIAAATGMDAVTHSIEGYVSSEHTAHTDAYALHALRLIKQNLQQAVEHPEDDEARGNMLVAANLAITPTTASAVGIAHSLSHSAGAHFGVPHGVANAIHLPWIIEYNAAGGPEIAARYADLAEVLGLDLTGDDVAAAGALADYVRDLTAKLGLPTKLSEVGVPAEGVDKLVETAIGDGCTFVNPRDPSEEDLAELYRKAL